MASNMLHDSWVLLAFCYRFFCSPSAPSTTSASNRLIFKHQFFIYAPVLCVGCVSFVCSFEAMANYFVVSLLNSVLLKVLSHYRVLNIAIHISLFLLHHLLGFCLWSLGRLSWKLLCQCSHICRLHFKEWSISL